MFALRPFTLKTGAFSAFLMSGGRAGRWRSCCGVEHAIRFALAIYTAIYLRF